MESMKNQVEPVPNPPKKFSSISCNAKIITSYTKEKFKYLKERYVSFNYKGIIGIVLIFALISTILFIERSGIQYNYGKAKLSILPEDKIVTKAEACEILKRDTLLLYDSGAIDSASAYKQFEVIFSDMKVGYDAFDLSKDTDYDFNKYQKVVILLSTLDCMGQNVITLCDWVKKGGQALFAVTLERTPFLSAIEGKLGIADASYDYAVVDSIEVDPEFMIGGKSFEIVDGYESAQSVQLMSKNVTVYAHTAGENQTPLIWETKYGEGKFVIDNFGLYEKVMRGFFAASYSLLGDVCVWPVINASTFYLDDFPSQIPQGNNDYIMRDYKTSIRDFYVNIWWPDMMNFADKYGIKYTGLAIECYDDAVDGSTKSEADKGTFLNFGNMLLRQGGEIGYHGYNHQPLCLGNVDYKGYFDYKTWESTEAMKSAFDDLVDLCDELFPNVNMSVYVPPSNVMSQEGREFLLNEYPQIKTISGIYFQDAEVEHSCVQEYEVSKDGVVDQPRVVSGCDLDPFMKLAVISELNLHYSNNHFTHPDDALDPDRGAELGWETLTERFDQYLDWLYSSAPMLRNLTGTETSAAVQRWAAASPDVVYEQGSMTVKISNFYDEVQLMIRINSKKTPSVKDGGELTHITGNLYLLKATKDTVTINLDGE